MHVLVSENDLKTIQETISDFKRYIKEPKLLSEKQWMEREIKDLQEIVDSYLEASTTIKEQCG